MPLQYVHEIRPISITYVHDANRPEKEDLVLKTYVYCMAKLSIKHLFICCGK